MTKSIVNVYFGDGKIFIKDSEQNRVIVELYQLKDNVSKDNSLCVLLNFYKSESIDVLINALKKAKVSLIKQKKKKESHYDISGKSGIEMHVDAETYTLADENIKISEEKWKISPKQPKLWNESDINEAKRKIKKND